MQAVGYTAAGGDADLDTAEGGREGGGQSKWGRHAAPRPRGPRRQQWTREEEESTYLGVKIKGEISIYKGAQEK